MKLFFLITILLLLCACTQERATTREDLDKIQPQANLTTQHAFPSWVEGCDRFRPMFTKELNQYPELSQAVDLPLLYALIYQESLCMTSQELKETREDNAWQGGIMQVDACWRWGAPYDCTTIQNQIHFGIKELNNGFERMQTELHKTKLNLTTEQQSTLFLIAYNRGYYVATDAIHLLKQKQTNHTFINNKIIKTQNSHLLIKVNCTEKDLCTNDGEFIDVTNEITGEYFADALLLACRSKYGYMRNEQGDYCTGPGYGLNYPRMIFEIRDTIQTAPEELPQKQQEFYSGDLKFANRTWFIKTSIGKTGPGPNYFYYDNTSAYVDKSGNLHLNILKRNNTWYASEVLLPHSLGYGEYSFLVQGDISKLDKNIVLGMFTYDLSYNTDPNYFHREIDMELAQWGQSGIENAQFALQGPLPLQAIRRFNLTTENDVRFTFNWQPDHITFTTNEPQTNTLLYNWTYQGELIPIPGEEQTRINLWIYNNTPEAEQEIVIKDFSFTAGR